MRKICARGWMCSRCYPGLTHAPWKPFNAFSSPLGRESSPNDCLCTIRMDILILIEIQRELRDRALQHSLIHGISESLVVRRFEKLEERHFPPHSPRLQMLHPSCRKGRWSEGAVRSDFVVFVLIVAWYLFCVILSFCQHSLLAFAISNVLMR